MKKDNSSILLYYSTILLSITTLLLTTLLLLLSYSIDRFSKTDRNIFSSDGINVKLPASIYLSV